MMGRFGVFVRINQPSIVDDPHKCHRLIFFIHFFSVGFVLRANELCECWYSMRMLHNVCDAIDDKKGVK